MKQLFLIFIIAITSILSGISALFPDDLKAEISKDDFNIVLITIDTLRADHLSCYGYERKTSPNIDKIAKKGTIFKNAIAPSSWTAPSMVSLFTSTYPINHGVVRGFNYRDKRKYNSKEVFSSDLITLPEILKTQGYTTFGVSSNHNLTAQFGFARGFDYFEYPGWVSADHVNTIVCSWEDALNKSDKYFLWIHYIDPHYPYNARSPWIDEYCTSQSSIKNLNLSIKSDSTLNSLIPTLKTDPQALSNLIALYDSEINYADSYLGELIKKYELNKNTLLIITSDHGEEFLEHNSIGHAKNLYQETIRIPLVIKLPHSSKRQIINNYVNLVDIMPTIIHMIDIDSQDQALGKPILDKKGQLSGLKTRKGKQAYSFAELDFRSVLKAIITPEWKYIYHDRGGNELYDVKSDPLELKNLVDKETEKCNQLREQLFNWTSSAKQYSTTRLSIQLSPEEREKLVTLGYLQVTGDFDKDGILDSDDNCPRTPNGRDLGTCIDCNSDNIGGVCKKNEDCRSGNICSMNQEKVCGDGKDFDGDGVLNNEDNCPCIKNPNQEDTYPPGGNGCGDACECIGDLDKDGEVGIRDVSLFKNDFGKKNCTQRNPCKSDFDCDGDVDDEDYLVLKENIGRMNCAACEFSCSYE